MSEYFKQAYTLLPVEQRQKEWYEDLEEQVCSIFPALTYQQRIIGCLTCLLIGFILSMGSTFRSIKLMEGDPEPFATMYTIGNIVGLFSTCFLYGPVSQVKQMFAPTRLFSLLADMPTVNFVGEIASSVVDVEEISVTWAIVPGNSAWYMKRGVSSGETHTCQSSLTVGTSTISHPSVPKLSKLHKYKD